MATTPRHLKELKSNIPDLEVIIESLSRMGGGKKIVWEDNAAKKKT